MRWLKEGRERRGERGKNVYVNIMDDGGWKKKCTLLRCVGGPRLLTGGTSSWNINTKYTIDVKHTLHVRLES